MAADSELGSASAVTVPPVPMTSDRRRGLEFWAFVFVGEANRRIGERQLEGAMGSAVIAIGKATAVCVRVKSAAPSRSASRSVAPARFGSTSSRPVAPSLLHARASNAWCSTVSRRVWQPPTREVPSY
jgi:hypothetical protein